MFQKCMLVALMMVLASCISQKKFNKNADSIAQSSYLSKDVIEGTYFNLTTFSKVGDEAQPLRFYIEGDGLAYITRRQASSNPTPPDPVALRLAAADPHPNIIYIARPCQFTSLKTQPRCHHKYWTTSRFADEVVVSTNDVIDHYKKLYNAESIELVGYSGGAAVAVLSAARRDDVVAIRTVAGNLDHVAVNRYHNVNQLTDSLNPMHVISDVEHIPQHHFIGSHDKVIPAYSVVGFAKKTARYLKCAKVSSVNGATHHSGWQEHWGGLLDEPLACATNVTTN